MSESQQTRQAAPGAVAPALPAATVTLVRDAGGGLEVLMMRRNLKSGFVPGMYVFPGGGLDREDLGFRDNGLCRGLDDAAASTALGLACDGIGYWVAAIREAFEEAGLLLALDARGQLPALDDAATLRRFDEHRRRLNAGSLGFEQILREEGLHIAADRLTYFAHWITPVSAPRRYDTRFFMAEAPAGQEPLHDDHETIAAVWVSPAQALSLHARGEFEMRTPTVRTLETFAQCDSVASLRGSLHAVQGNVPALLPRIARNGQRLLPGEPGYEEAGTAQGAGKWDR